MKNISKTHYKRLMELYNNPKWMDSYLQAIAEAGYHVIGLEEVHNCYGDWTYIWLTRCNPKYMTGSEDEKIYLMFGDDDRTVFYVGKEKVRIGYSRFCPEAMKKFLEMWTELQRHCSNNC